LITVGCPVLKVRRDHGGKFVLLRFRNPVELWLVLTPLIIDLGHEFSNDIPPSLPLPFMLDFCIKHLIEM
jgi:hypothetical protein